MLFTTFIEVVQEIIREGRGWTITLALLGGVLVASLMFTLTPPGPGKAYAVTALFFLGSFLGAVAGLSLDRRRKNPPKRGGE